MSALALALVLAFTGSDPCAESAGEPSADLYCVELLPSARAPDAHGEAWLVPPPSPFGLSVTAEGSIAWNLEFDVAGLPDPASLGPYSAYVAWATTPVLDPMTRLGPVTDGTTRLGPFAYDRFLILVSAEPSADVNERSGPIVLRGASAGTRLQPHDFGALLAASGAPPDRPGSAGDEGGGHDHGPAGPRGWIVPPMHPAVPMLSGLERLAPSVGPWRPAEDPATLPAAAPRRVVELSDGDSLHLVARPVRRMVRGRPIVLYAFNGQLPGPLVRVSEGATITVGFVNETAWPATIHWHGIRIENAFDGVPGVTQEAVAPGASFRYRVRFPDAGIYWYHPHHREDVLQDMGLYGNLLVAPSAWDLPPVHREEILALDDFLVADSGAVPWGEEGATHAMMGRFGNLTLVNGEPAVRLGADRGEVVRFYLTNVANTRTFNVSFGGAPIKVIASDLGPFQREAFVRSVVLGPAERYVVEVRFDAPGEAAITSRVRAVDHVYGGFVPVVDTLGTVAVSGEPAAAGPGRAFDALAERPGAIEGIEDLRSRFDDPPEKILLLTMEADGLPWPVGPLMRLDALFFNPIEWVGTMPRMNWASTTGEVRWILRDAATGDENREIAWRFQVGELVRIRLLNDREAFHAMHHPIHIHGQRFLVLAVNGRPNDNLAWKDTAIVPAGGTLDLLLEITNPGDWMLHCHISEHLEAGMKTIFSVDGEDPLDGTRARSR